MRTLALVDLLFTAISTVFRHVQRSRPGPTIFHGQWTLLQLFACKRTVANSLLMPLTEARFNTSMQLVRRQRAHGVIPPLSGPGSKVSFARFSRTGLSAALTTLSEKRTRFFAGPSAIFRDTIPTQLSHTRRAGLLLENASQDGVTKAL